MKKFVKGLSLLLVLVLVLSMFSNTAFAASTFTGKKVYFTPLKTSKVYAPTDGAKALADKYGMVYYENPNRALLRGEVMLVQLRTIQASLNRQGKDLLSNNNYTLSNFKDKSKLCAIAQSEAKILKALTILTTAKNSYMKMEDVVSRGEVAKILYKFNKYVFGMPAVRSKNAFKDITNSKFKTYIAYVYNADLMDGITTSKFYPGNAISMEQMLEILNNEVDNDFGITEKDVASAMKQTFKLTYDLTEEVKQPVTETVVNAVLNQVTELKVNVSTSNTKNLVFKSSDETVCTVLSVDQTTDTAKLFGLKVGSTTLSIGYEGETATTTVLVNVVLTAPTVVATGLTVTKEVNLQVGGSSTLIATITPSNVTDKTVKYSSYNSNVAYVDSTGKVVGVSVGTTVILSETNNGFKAYTTVNVTTSAVAATSLTATQNVSIAIGETSTIATTVLPYNVTDKTVRFTSNDSSIAYVDTTGKITALKAGTTFITVETSNGLKAYTTVTVTASAAIPVTSLTVTQSVNIAIGQSSTIVTTVLPYNATDRSVRFTSNDSSIAYVDTTGKITALKAGTTFVIAETNNGLKAYTTVTVTASTSTVVATSITVTESISVAVGQSSTITSTVLPSNAIDKTVKYTINDSSIAYVDAAGKVTALKAGSTFVIAETSNGIKAYCVVTVTAATTVTPTPTNTKSHIYVNGFGESSYYNAMNSETMTFVIDTDYAVSNVTLSNNNCTVTQNLAAISGGYQFTLKAGTFTVNTETLVTVKLSNGTELKVNVVIYP